MAPYHVSHSRPQPACSFINDLRGFDSIIQEHSGCWNASHAAVWLIVWGSELQRRRLLLHHRTAVLLLPTTINPNHMHNHFVSNIIGQCQHLVKYISWWLEHQHDGVDVERGKMWKDCGKRMKMLALNWCPFSSTVSECTSARGFTIFVVTHIQSETIHAHIQYTVNVTSR